MKPTSGGTGGKEHDVDDSPILADDMAFEMRSSGGWSLLLISEDQLDEVAVVW